MQADRSTIFFYDKAKNMLWSKVAKGTKDIRFSADTGIAGEVCKTKLILNIKNPQTDPRFNASIDKKTGYKTNSILAVPIFGEGGDTGEKVLGVLQILNKLGGTFNERDEQKAILMTKQISAAMTMHIAREAEREEKERSPEPAKPAPKTVARSRSISPTPGGSGRRRAATMGGVGVGGMGASRSGLGSPIQRSNLSPSFENLMSIGVPSPSNRSFSPRGSPRNSPVGFSRRLNVSTSGGGGGGGGTGSGGGGGAAATSVTGEMVLRLSKFFASLTSDRALVSEATVCALAGSELPKLLDVTNVSLWVKDASGTHLWNTQGGEGSEKLVVNAGDGPLGACVNGRNAHKMTKPTWTDIGTMSIPGMSVSEPVESVLCVPVEVGGEVRRE